MGDVQAEGLAKALDYQSIRFGVQIYGINLGVGGDNLAFD